MANIRTTTAGIALTAALIGGGLIAAPAANAAPFTATATATATAGTSGVSTPRLDSKREICAGLSVRSKGKNQSAAYKKCAVELADAHTLTASELKCYRAAGVAVAGLVVQNKLSAGNAKTLALRLLAAGAFGCIAALWV